MKRYLGLLALVIGLMFTVSTVSATTSPNFSTGMIGGLTNDIEVKLNEKTGKVDIVNKSLTPVVTKDKKTGKVKIENPSLGKVKQNEKTGKLEVSSNLGTVEIKSEEYLVYDLTYSNYKDHLSHFTSKAWFEGEWFGFSTEMNYMFNSLVQMVFWITKSFFQVSSSIYEFTMADSGIDSYVSTVLSTSSAIFSTLASGEVLGLIAIISLVYAWKRFMDGGNFFALLFRFFAIYGLTLLVYTPVNGEYLVQRAYNATSTVMNRVANDITDVSGAYHGDSAVLDRYFIQAIWKPYVYMNSSPSSIADDGTVVDSDLTTDQLKELLTYNQGDDDWVLSDETDMKGLVGTDKEPKVPMMKNAWGSKFLYALASVIESGVMGIFVALLGIMFIVLKMLFLLLLMFSPFILVLGLMPALENLLFNFGKNVVTLAVVSSGINIIGTIGLYAYNVLGVFIEGLSKSSNYFLIVFIKLVVIYFLYRYRFMIVRLVAGSSGGRVMMRFGSRFRQMSRRKRAGASKRMKPRTNNELSRLGRVRNFAGGVTRQTWRNTKAKSRELVNDRTNDHKDWQRQNRKENPKLDKLSEANTRRKAFSAKISGMKHAAQSAVANFVAKGVKQDAEGYQERAQKHKEKAKEQLQRSMEQQRKADLKKRLKERRKEKASAKPEVADFVAKGVKQDVEGYQEKAQKHKERAKEQLQRSTEQQRKADLKKRLRERRNEDTSKKTAVVSQTRTAKPIQKTWKKSVNIRKRKLITQRQTSNGKIYHVDNQKANAIKKKSTKVRLRRRKA